MSGFTIVPCPKCSAQVHVVQTVGVAYCPSCHTQVGAQGGSSAAPGMVMPNMRIPSAPSKAGIFAGAAGAIVLGIGFTVFKVFLHGALPGVGGHAPGKVSVSELGIQEKAADPDQMISAVRARAKAWRKDAEFYSVNVLGLGPSGTVDLTEGGSVVTVEYFSPSAVGSNSVTERQNAIVKFTFNSVGMNQEVWGVKEKSEHVPATPVPHCAAKQIGQMLAGKGLTAGKTAHINLDPQSAFATNKLSYNVLVDDPKLHLFLDIDTCAVLKELK